MHFLYLQTIHFLSLSYFALSQKCVSGRKCLCVSSHKHLMCQWSKVMFYSSRPFVSPITSFTWTTPPLPLPAVEILRPWGRNVHLQCRVMMFFVDYSSSSHQKLNRRTGRLRPVTSRAHVRPPFTRSASRPLRVHLQCVS
jgi:hypothetical protein